MLTSQKAAGRLLLTVPTLLLMAACQVGEANEQPEDASVTAAAETQEEEMAPMVPVGTTMSLRMAETISTQSHEAGDGFTATVTEPVHASDGSVLIASGATMYGTVETSERSTDPEDPAALTFRFDELQVDGNAYPVTATVESAEARQTEGDSEAESAAKVAFGAAAGALVGQVLGKDTESTLQGAAVGAAAGTVVAVASRNGDATLEEGSQITVRTEEPIRVD